MERTKILFGNDNRLDGSLNTSNSNNVSQARQRSSQMLRANSSQQSGGNSSANGAGDGANKQLIDLLRSSSATINRTELLNALKGSTRAEINQAISSLLSSSASTSTGTAQEGAESANTSSNTLTANASSASLSSLASQKQSKTSRSPNSESEEATGAVKNSTDVAANTGKYASTSRTFHFIFSKQATMVRPARRRSSSLHHSIITLIRFIPSFSDEYYNKRYSEIISADTLGTAERKISEPKLFNCCFTFTFTNTHTHSSIALTNDQSFHAVTVLFNLIYRVHTTFD